MKNTRVKVRIKDDIIVDATIKDSVIISGETHYLCELFDPLISKRFLEFVHCTDVVEVLS